MTILQILFAFQNENSIVALCVVEIYAFFPSSLNLLHPSSLGKEEEGRKWAEGGLGVRKKETNMIKMVQTIGMKSGDRQ